MHFGQTREERSLLYVDVVCIGASKGHKARLIHDLLEGYDPDARPIKNDSNPAEPVIVTFALSYNQLQNLVRIYIFNCLLSEDELGNSSLDIWKCFRFYSHTSI